MTRATGEVYRNNDGDVIAWVNPGSGPVLGAGDASDAIKNAATYVADVIAAGYTGVEHVQLNQPLWHIEPCTECGSTAREVGFPSCCWPVSDRMKPQFEGGAGLVQPTDLELAQMMGGNKYQDEHDGRFPFRVVADGNSHLVEMPSIPLDEVRFIGNEDQNIWDFPRLFVDGSSWVWKYAVSALKDES